MINHQSNTDFLNHNETKTCKDKQTLCSLACILYQHLFQPHNTEVQACIGLYIILGSIFKTWLIMSYKQRQAHETSAQEVHFTI